MVTKTRRAGRPLWAGHVGSAGAALLCLGLTMRAVAGDHTLLGLPGLTWPSAVLLLVGAVAAAASVRPWGLRLPGALITIGLVLVAALTLAGSSFVLLNLIELVVTGSVTDRDGDGDWATFAERLAAAALAALFAASALSWHRRTSGRCTHCGESHGTGAVQVTHPAPHAAPGRVRWTAYAGCAAFIPYLTVHGLGMAGLIPGNERHYDHVEAPWPLVFAASALGLVGPAVFLLLGLVRPWGMAFPRWTIWLSGRRVPRLLPLVPVWFVAPTLALYGVGSVVYAVAEGHDLWGLGGAASLAFGGYGGALAVAAVSYQDRTRPRCDPPTTAAHRANPAVHR
jgi:hypothetical protein